MSESLLATIITGVLLVVIGVGSYLGYEYRSNTARAEKAEEQAKQTTAIANNVINAVSLFNQISQAGTDEKQQNSEKSSARVVVIREAVKGDKCAVQSVPSAATNSLRDHRNKIRSGAGGADTG
ncbi:TPA: DUF2570 domain-containing protein [Raoultella ornithinolytica]